MNSLHEVTAQRGSSFSMLPMMMRVRPTLRIPRLVLTLLRSCCGAVEPDIM